jgi:hypothetical protein
MEFVKSACQEVMLVTEGDWDYMHAWHCTLAFAAVHHCTRVAFLHEELLLSPAQDSRLKKRVYLQDSEQAPSCSEGQAGSVKRCIGKSFPCQFHLLAHAT